MATNNVFSYGTQVKAWLKAEATYDTILTLAATDAISPVEIKIEPSHPWEKTKERVGTASTQGFIRKKSGGKFTLKAYVKPNAAGTAPDIGEALKHAFYTETVSGGTSVTYAHADSDPTSLQMAVYAGPGRYHVISGMGVEQVDIDIQADAPPEITFSGFFASHGWLFGAQVNTNALSTATTVYYKTAHKGNVGVGALAKFGAEDNGGAGYRVTAVDDSASPPALTISPGLAAGISSDDAIAPVIPSSTLSGTILNALSCALTIDGSSVGFTRAKYSYKTGYHPRNKEASASRPTGVLRGDREVAMELEAYFISQDTGPYAGRTFGTIDVSRAIVLRVGEAAANPRMTINVPALKINEAAEITESEKEETMFTLKGIAKQSAAAGDESTLVYA